jgi:hypothetical protein
MKVKNKGSGVTGDEVDETTMEHRNIRPVAWAKSIWSTTRAPTALFSSFARNLSYNGTS